MKLAEVFAAIGGEVVDLEGDLGAALVVRLRLKPKDLAAEQRYTKAIEYMLGNPQESFEIDISRHYTMKAGRVVYFWRWIISGDSTAALKHLVSHVRQLVASAPKQELSSFPVPNPMRREPRDGYGGVTSYKEGQSYLSRHGVS